MICKHCGKEIQGNPEKCPYCKRKLKKQVPKKPGLLKPIVSLILSIVMLAASITGVVFNTVVAQEKASDVKTDGKVVTEYSGEKEYDIDNIQKDPIDLSSINTTPNKTGSESVREEISAIETAIDEGLVETVQEHPLVDSESSNYYINAVRNVARDLYYDDVIENYYADDDNIIFDLKFGGYYVYAPHIDGYDSGSVPELKVSTYQPFYSAGQYENVIEYRPYADNGAKIIADNLEPYVFNVDGSYDADYNDAEVNVSNVASFGNYNVIIWHGHGTYNYSFGPILCLGESRTAETDEKYHDLLMSGDLLYSKSTYYIGSSFVENRISDGSLENSVIYLGACKSGYDDKLANAFLDKGAAAVYATSDSILTVYNAKMMYSISEGLTRKNSDGSLYTVTQALEYAKNTNGDSDGGDYDAQVELFTNTPEFSLDWYEDYVVADRDVVLVLDVSGSMSGTPLDETKEAAVEFVQTVLDENARISIVEYESSAEIKSNFSSRGAALISTINSLNSGGGTNIDDGLQKAEALLADSKANKKIIVLMTDGIPNDGRCGDELVSYAEQIKNQDIYIYTLGFFSSLSDGEKVNAKNLLDRIATKGHHYEVANADDLVYFFGDMADTISGQKYIYIEIACPVDVTVSKDGDKLSSDSKDMNTRTSFGTLTLEEVASEDEGDEPTTKKILRLKDGMEYDIKIEGNGKGKMDYTIKYMDENGDYTDTREFKNIKITKSTEISTVAASTRPTTTLSVDEDGDGRFEQIFKANKNEKGKEVDKTLLKVFGISSLICLIWMLISILIIVIQVKRRKKFVLQSQVVQ